MADVFDYKKEYKALYSPKDQPVIIEVPEKTSVDIYNSLSGPADENNIKELENTLKTDLPDTFKESLLIHNGQNETGNIITFVDYHKLLSANEMTKNYKMLCGLFGADETVDFIEPDNCKYIKRNYIYNHKWLKFTESNGDGLIMDFDPGVKGTIGQIFFRPNGDNPVDKTIAKSYGNWLKKLCEKIENKEYKINNGEIVFEDIIFIE